MQRTFTIAMAVIGLALAGPLAAHHMSDDPDFVDGQVPEGALDQHELVVGEVLEMGVASMAGATTADQMEMSGTAMDPADEGARSGPGNLDSDPNATRSPPIRD